MSRRDNDPIGHAPKIVPAHDEIASYQRNKAKGSLVASLGEVPDVLGNGGSLASITVLAVVVLVLLAMVGTAGYLYQKLSLAEQAIQNYELRISDLERRLSVTDESMSESSVAIKVKVRELDSEIRKLWDNVWKKTKQQFAEHDAQLKKHEQRINQSDVFIVTAKRQILKNDTVVAGLTTQLAKAKKMQLTVAANQKTLGQQEARFETTADKLNLLNSHVKKLDRRIKDTEEWVDSINGFRRQVNRDIGTLKQHVGQLQGSGQ
ncbi:MAG: hypothetical protein V3T17_00165 [Pseudomonadales bacterium]